MHYYEGLVEVRLRMRDKKIPLSGSKNLAQVLQKDENLTLIVLRQQSTQDPKTIGGRR